ncbi:MAG: NRDE family protein [Armatimonadetes bacterium]|nr:NRDE family protein [Armatimonadota bacterium]
MCTVTVLRQPGRVLVTMNRDELRTRSPELRPSFQDGWWGPRDQKRGGTWMGAGRQGLVVCLLNGYRRGEPVRSDPAAPSRGEIVPAVLSRPGLPEAVHWLRRDFDASRYASFLLVLADLEETWELYGSSHGVDAWRREGPDLMVTSSAWVRADGIRSELFRRWLDEDCPFQGFLPEFHLLRVPGLEEASPLMERPEAATRSITQVEMHSGGGTLRYWPAPAPDSRQPGVEIEFKV